jgi:hypothetical protein
LSSPPPQLSFILPSPIPGILSTGIIFYHLHTCVHVFALYSPSYPFPCHLPNKYNTFNHFMRLVLPWYPNQTNVRKESYNQYYSWTQMQNSPTKC